MMGIVDVTAYRCCKRHPASSRARKLTSRYANLFSMKGAFGGQSAPQRHALCSS